MENKFEEWAIIQLMGHKKLAGRVSESPIGGSTLIRVDIPETKSGPAFTKLIGVGSIYDLTITDEQTAKAIVEALQPVPITRFEAKQLLSGDYKDDDLPY